jgi:hypothetical protein
MAVVSNNPFPNKWMIEEEQGGQDRYWSNVTTLDDLLFAHGQHVADYADVSHIVKGLAYAKLGITESVELSPLMEFLQGISGGESVETVNKNFVRWKIYGEPDRRAQSLGNVNDPDNLYLGAGGLEFEFWSDVDWYKAHDVLAPVRNKRVQIVVQSDEAREFDGGYIYDVRVLGTDDDFLDPDFLISSEYWLKMGSIQSHGEIGTFGSIQFGQGFSYMEFEAPLTTMGWEFTVEGEAHRQWGNLEITRCDDEGRPMPEEKKITNFLEGQAMMQMDYEKELFIAYGSQSENLIDKNTGKPITTGPGVFEFLECGQVIGYSPEAHGMEYVMERLEALWFDRVPVSKRDVVFYTGQAGLKLFSEWVNQKFGESAATYDYSFILSPRTPFDNRGGRKGFAFAAPQFTEYVLPTFGSVKVAHWPILDNTRINGVNYPGSYYPASSYEFIAFNTGFGEAPIQFFNRVDNKISTYLPGLWSPAGAIGETNPIWKTGDTRIGDAYKYIHRETFGVVMADPSTTLWFKPNVSY